MSKSGEEYGGRWGYRAPVHGGGGHEGFTCSPWVPFHNVATFGPMGHVHLYKGVCYIPLKVVHDP